MKSNTPATPGLRVPAAELQAFVATLFARAGLRQADATVVAQALVWANLRGVDTHGVSRVAHYLEFIANGVINPARTLSVTVETLAVTVLDADRAAGPVAMQQATELAMAKARSAGLGLVMVRNTTHTGALGCYTQSLAQRGMLGLSICASNPMMAFHGARAAGVSTAPLSMAVPGAGAETVLLDMASSIVSFGQIMQAKRQNLPLAPGLALDAAGEPTTDSQVAKIPMPLGGPKGSGLSLMIEMFTSLTVGNPLIAEFFSGNPEGKKHRQNAWVLALDVFKFCPEPVFRADVARTVAALKALPASVEGADILMPGERGYREAALRGSGGIPLSGKLAGELAGLATRFELNPPWGGTE